MADLLRRQDIMTKLAGGYQAEVEKIKEKINGLLMGAKVFPITISEEVYGTLPPIVEKVKKLLIESGWTVTLQSQGKEWRIE